MRKLGVVLMILGVLGSSALSQLKISKGSIVGVGLSLFKSGYGEGYLPRINSGVFAKVQVLEGLAIRPEVAYSQRGEQSDRNSIILEYIDFSLLADYKYELDESSGLSVNLMAGPMWSRLFQASHQSHSGLMTVATDIYGQTTLADFGFLFGAGVGIDVGNGSMFVESRMFIGTKGLTIPTFGYPMFNRSLSFVTGFEF